MLDSDPRTAFRCPRPNQTPIAACVGLSPSNLRSDRHAPVLAGLGTDFVLVELSDHTALGAATGRPKPFGRPQAPMRSGSQFMIYIRDGNTIRARMFAPLGGIPEDPATGSAAAASARSLGVRTEQAAVSRSPRASRWGVPSFIEASVTVEAGVPVAVRIGGQAVRVMEGRMVI